jgi:hypothetical protein
MTAILALVENPLALPQPLALRLARELISLTLDAESRFACVAAEAIP